MSLLELNESWKPRRRNMIRRKYWRGGQLGNVYVVLHQLITAELTIRHLQRKVRSIPEYGEILIVALIEQVKTSEPYLAEVEKRLEGTSTLSPWLSKS
jgi:hypothetical protein